MPNSPFHAAVMLVGLIGSNSLSLPRVSEADFQACGPCCLYMVCVMRGVEPDFGSLMSKFQLGAEGEASIHDLEVVARSYGLVGAAAKVNPDLLRMVPCPFIAHVKLPSSHLDHFVLVLGITERGVVYVDRPHVPTLERAADFSKRCSGYVLAFGESNTEAEQFVSFLSWQRRMPFVEATLVAAVTTMLLAWLWIIRQLAATRSMKN